MLYISICEYILNLVLTVSWDTNASLLKYCNIHILNIDLILLLLWCYMHGCLHLCMFMDILNIPIVIYRGEYFNNGRQNRF